MATSPSVVWVREVYLRSLGAVAACGTWWVLALIHAGREGSFARRTLELAFARPRIARAPGLLTARFVLKLAATESLLDGLKDLLGRLDTDVRGEQDLFEFLGDRRI